MVIVDTAHLRQQAWRAEEVYDQFIAYAKRIGCSVVHDEVVADEEKSRLLSKWWQEHVVT